MAGCNAEAERVWGLRSVETEKCRREQELGWTGVSCWGRWDGRSGRWKWTKVRLVKRTRRPRVLWHLFTSELEGKLVQCSNANIASRCAPPIDKEVGLLYQDLILNQQGCLDHTHLWSFLLAMTKDAWDALHVNRRRTFHIGTASKNCFRLLRWHQRTKSQSLYT